MRPNRPGDVTLSVVMPAYNEAANIRGALDDVMHSVLRLVPDAEIVVVDDGSLDATAAAVQAYADRDGRVHLMRQANGGHGPALVRGILASQGEYCLLLDSDRQVGLERFAETWRLCATHDAVIGVRHPRDDPRHRVLLSRALRRVLQWGCGVHATDANAPYKLVRRPALLQALAAMPEQPLIPSVLLTMHLCRSKATVVEQVVPHRRRAAGEASLRLGRLMRFCAYATMELARFRMGRSG